MRPLLAFPLLLLLIALSGCNDCKKTTICEYPEGINLYFHPYQKNNWWVYSNQDQSKIDSIFLTSYFYYQLDDSREISIFRKKDCKKFEQTIFDMNTAYFGKNANRPSFMVYNSDLDCSSANVSLYHETYDFDKPSNFSYNKANGFVVGNVIPTVTLSTGKTYINVLTDENEKVFFASDVGMIRFIIAPDTFDLKKYFIQ